MLIQFVHISKRNTFSLHMQVILCLIIFTITLTSTHQQTHSNTFEYFVKTYLSHGTMNNAYLNYTEYIECINAIANSFPNLTTLDSIGYSYNNVSIPLLIISNKTKHNVQPHKSLLINGMIHGREPVSMMMNLYIIFHLLTAPEQLLKTILNDTQIYFIPIINVDAYIINCNNYISLRNISNSYYRKNRHFDINKRCNFDNNNGVDLNRNFKFGFAYDEIGSSSNACDEAYRGETPFSEPETQAYRDFIISHDDIVIAINYHTWGNLVITPYNYLSVDESKQKMQKDKGYQVLLKYYEEFQSEAMYPEGFEFGNGMKTIKYSANGDCSDWLLGERQILAFSPELGNGKSESNTFYPNKKVTFDIIEKNLPSALYAVQKVKYFLKAKQILSYYSECKDIRNDNNNNLRRKDNDVLKCDNDGNDEVVHLEIGITNEGFSDYVTDEYNEIYLGLNITFGNIRKVIYWYENENPLVINVNDDNTTPQPDDSVNSYLKIPLYTHIPSRSNITLVIEIICDKDIFLKQYDKIVSSNSTYSMLLSISNVNQHITTTYPIFNNKNNNNEYKTFTWLFNSPSVTFYYSNLTDYTNISETLKENKKKVFFTITSIVLCGCVLLLISFLLYIIILIFKHNKSQHHTLHEEQVSIPQINKQPSFPSPGTPQNEDNHQIYIELPNIPVNQSK